MKYLPANTLAYYNAAPQTHLHDLSELPTSVLAKSSKQYRDAGGQYGYKVSPNDDAVTFYALNHAVALIRKEFTPNEPLPAWAQKLMEAYTDVTMKQGERMLHYILLITTREMRHVHGTTALWEKVGKALGPKAVALLQNISSEGGEETAMNKYLAGPDMTIGDYVSAIAYGFWKGWGDYTPENMDQWSGGYGGPTWAMVTEAAKSMLTGEASMEMLVDHGYTLAHNGGPIWNKIDVKIYVPQDTTALMTTLDVQRSGQMLDLMLASNTFGVKKTTEAVNAAQVILEKFPKALNGSVDWALVDSLRPEKEKQNSPHKYSKMMGVPPVAPKKPVTKKVVVPTKPVAPPKPQVVLLHGKPVKVVGNYQVYPYQTVKVVERQAK